MSWQEHIIKDNIDTRLDRYLRKAFPDLTQGTVEKALRKKDIKVNGKRAEASTRLAKDDVISYFSGVISGVGADRQSAGNKSYSSNVIALAKKILAEYKIYDSDEFIAIDKPHGLAVQGGSKVNISVDHALQYLNDTNGLELKLVHRLDKATSGVLLIAKGDYSAMKLTGAFKDKLISKTYIAKLTGVLKGSSGIVDNYIGKQKILDGYEANIQDGINYKEIMHVVDEDIGKRAITRYKVIKTDKKSQTSLVEFYPETGRTHQLRVHSKYLGAPIIGDVKYGGPKSERMLLHAKRLVISEEIFNREIVIESENPKLD